MDGMFSAVAVGIAGLGLIAVQQLWPAGPGLLAAVIPPWQRDGAARIAALDMPLLDIRWGGRLVIVDPGPGPGLTGAARIWRAGLVPLNASTPATCLARTERGETG
ncbi:MAG: hypothetical protein ACK4GT_08165 [Pararhodobacter sp.]